MESEGTKITIKSKLFQEVYKIHWTIENFDMIPFLDYYPVCSPYFLLGRHMDTTWSLLMSKQIHEGKENVGFKLVRTEDDTSWNSVVVSLSVIMEDGRLVKCIDEEVLGGESQNQYIFLIRPSECKPATKCIQGQEATNNCKDDTPTISEANIISLSSKIENIVSLVGSIVPRNASCSFEDTEPKKSNEQEGTVTKLDAESGSQKVENGHSLKPLPKIESCRMGDSWVKVEGEAKEESGSPKVENGHSVKPLPKIESCRMGDSWVKVEGEAKEESGSPKVENGHSVKPLPKIESCRMEDSWIKIGGETQEDCAELKPEQLLNQKDLTVVCRIKYTYMVCNKLEDVPKKSVGFDVIDAFKYLHDSGDFSDVTLKCKDVHFPCHKAVLGPISSVFNEVLQSKSHPTPMTVNLHMPLHIARAFIIYIYKRELTGCFSAGDYRDLCYIADHFNVLGMKDRCLGLMKMLEYEESSSEEEEEGKVRLDKKPELLYSIAS